MDSRASGISEIRLRDSRSGELLPLSVRDSERGVRIYACGPTVYSRIHVGNARPFVVFSLLKRFLEHEGLRTRLVVNVTDVNDKIYDAARAQGRESAELALEMTALYREDTDALGLGRPDCEPLASAPETIESILNYIRTLIEGGHAYPTGGDVYFRVRSDPAYGTLSHRHLEDMDQGEDALRPDPPLARKEDPLDFALWKGHKEGEDTVWDSPWGAGRPGWHIECSAMAEEFLEVDLDREDFAIDIHGGGSDLLFPHHENEAAQTRGAHPGKELARIWMHNGMIQTTGEKMAKSLGNIAPLHEVLTRHSAETIVMYLISGHYRQPLAYSEGALEQAKANVSRIKEAARRLQRGDSSPDLDSMRDGFFAALANDFNTPEALAWLNDWIRAGTQTAVSPNGDEHLREMLGVLGLESLLAGPLQAPALVEELARRRELARGERDFSAADRLRDEIVAQGWEVRDGSGGFELLPL